jgi:hypothetical protein
MQGDWQQEGQVWFYVLDSIVYAAQIVPKAIQFVVGTTEHNAVYEAFDLNEAVPEGQAGPKLIGEYLSVDEAKQGVEKHFQEQNK